MTLIYLDHNATAPMLPEVVEAMLSVLRRPLGNPSSSHAFGRQARRLLEDAREGIAELLGVRLAPPHRDALVLTSGGTEANNLALRGLAGAGPIVISQIEHPSILNTARHLAQAGTTVRLTPATPSGVIDLDQMIEQVKPGTRLACLMLVNNETGVLQPVAELTRHAHAAGCRVLCDACQAVGKMPVHFSELQVDLLTVAAHKFHGPVGIGALLVRGGVEVPPLLLGGGQELGIRPGTEAVALAVGFHTALRQWSRERDERAARLETLRDELERRLMAELPELIIHGRQSPRMPHTSNMAFVGVDRQAMLLALDAAGVACSAGSACASGSPAPSPTLLAMGCGEELVRSSLRFSLGATTTAAEVEQAAISIINVYKNLRGRR